MTMKAKIRVKRGKVYLTRFTWSWPNTWIHTVTLHLEKSRINRHLTLQPTAEQHMAECRYPPSRIYRGTGVVLVTECSSRRTALPSSVSRSIICNSLPVAGRQLVDFQWVLRPDGEMYFFPAIITNDFKTMKCRRLSFLAAFLSHSRIICPNVKYVTWSTPQIARYPSTPHLLYPTPQHPSYKY